MTLHWKSNLPKTAIMTGGLLLSTALPLTAAQAMPVVGLSVGGQFTQSVNIVDADNGRNADGDTTTDTLEDEVLAQNAEIHFKGKTSLPSGTEFGFRVELEAESRDDGDQIDEHYLYVKGDFGKLILGAENGVGHLMQVRAPRFVPGLKAYDNSLTDAAIEKAYDIVLERNAIEDAHMSTKLEHISGDANKISYMTPKVGGLQVGVSFTPNNENRNGGENNAANVADAEQTDILELALRYSGKIGGVGYRFGYSSVEGETEGGGANEQDPESTSVGLQLSLGKYVFGGNMSEYENLGEVDDNYADSESIETVNYALKYRLNKTTDLGISFTDGEETHTDNSVTSYEEMMIGGGRKIAPGIRLGYYYTMTEATHGSGNDRKDSEVKLAGVTLDLKF